MSVTLWRFYNDDISKLMINNYKKLNLPNGDVSPYAFTRDKDIAKRFKKERNMKKFHIFKDEISIEEYRKYAVRFQENMLGYFKISKLENNELVTVSVLANDVELYNTDMDPVEQVIELVQLTNIPDPTILKSEFSDALDALRYTGLWAIVNDVGDTLDAPEFKLDQFSVYFDNILMTL